MAGLNDTQPEAEQVLVNVFRQMPLARKWLLMGETYDDGRMLHAIGVRLRNPLATRRDILEDWLRIQLGLTHLPPLSEPPLERPMQSMHDLREVLRVFSNLGISYALGGSMASSIHGIRRDTLDADITAEPFPGNEPQLASAFSPDYYLSLPAIQQAVRQRTSFNIINTATGFKVDVFIRKDRPFEQSAMSRRLTVDLPDAPGEPLSLYTPEDVILFKLWWYRLGQESASQQWTDVQGVLKVQAGRLDQAYLDHWAADLGVSDLLQRARRESGV
jgi:hypothetical protein